MLKQDKNQTLNVYFILPNKPGKILPFSLARGSGRYGRSKHQSRHNEGLIVWPYFHRRLLYYIDQ